MQVFLSEEILRLPWHFKYIHWGHALLDSIESRICKPDPPKIKKKPPSNRAIELVDISTVVDPFTSNLETNEMLQPVQYCHVVVVNLLLLMKIMITY